MAAKRRGAAVPLAAAALLIAAGFAVYKMIIAKEYADDEVLVKKRLGKSLCLVVDRPTDHAQLLVAYPGLVIVGTQNVSLKTGGTDDFRLIETETADGWIHVVKHLRPGQLIAEDHLLERLPAGIERFVKETVTAEEARELGLQL